MVTQIGDIILIDTDFLSSVQAGSLREFLELIDDGKREFKISTAVLEQELGINKRDIVEEWVDSLGGRFERINPVVNPDDLENPRYNPKNNPGQLGDVGYKKWLDEVADRNLSYTILTNDSELAEFGRDLDHVSPVGRTGSFLSHRFLISDEALRAESLGDNSFKDKYNRIAFDPNDGLARGVGEEAEKAKIKNKYLPNAEAVNSSRFSELPQQRLIDFSEGSQVPNDGVNEPGRFLKRFFSEKFLEGLSALGEASKTLPAIGLAFSAFFLASDYAEASTLYEETPDDPSKGNRFLVEFLFETLGGTVFGAAGFFAGSGVFSLALAVGGGIAGSLLGKQLGGYLYDQFPTFFDKAIADIWQYAQDIGGALGEGIDLASAFFERIFSPFTVDEEDGDEEAQFIIADRFGEVFGGSGDDFLLGISPEFVFKDALINPNEPEPAEGEKDTRVRAETDLRLTLDGGTGDDTIITLGGTGAITVGGEGRDFLFNTSEFGEIYGDTISGLDNDGNPLDHTGSNNADTFWYWPGTFIKDAQPNDRITLFGLPLVGGSNAVGGVAAGDGSLALDFFNFSFAYGSTFSGQLLIINRLAQILGIGPSLGPTTPLGTQVVENYDFGGFSDETYGRAAPGDLGLTFRIFLPLDRALEGVVISLFNAVWGSLFTVLDAAEQLAKLNLFFFIPPQPSRKFCY